MLNSLRHSVIVPLYNKAPYIARAIRSVLAQDFEDYELIIVDDGSTDDGARIVREQFEDPRIRLISQRNAGVGAARNRGIAEMRGEIASFLDADDEWWPSHLRDLAEVATVYPEAGLIATGYRSLYSRGLGIDRTIDRSSLSLIPDYYQFATTGYAINMSSCGARNWLLARGVKFREGVPVGEDTEFYLQAALYSPMAYHPRVSAVYDRNVVGSAMASAAWSAELPLAAASLIQMLRERVVSPNLEGSARAYLAWMIEYHALAGLGAGNRTEALTALRNGQFQPISDKSKRRLHRLELVVQVTPSLLCKLGVRFRQSRWGLSLANVFSDLGAQQAQSSAVRATARRNNSPPIMA